MKNLENIDLKGKKIFLRADLNMPVKDGVIQDYSRIDRLKPTIKFLKGKGAKIILASHFDRPDGKRVDSMSLEFLVPILKEKFEIDFNFCSEAIGQIARNEAQKISESTALLLENLRFYKGEESNDKEFAKELASLAEIYINDAFACSHRAHASISAITEFLPSYAGLLMLEELSNLEASLSNNSRPIAAIVGGKKVSSKFPILHNLSTKVDKLVICGAMANTFLKAKGFEIYSSYHEAEIIEEVKTFISKCQCEIILPKDVVCAQYSDGEFKNPYVSNVEKIKESSAILDIGFESCAEIIEAIKVSKTVVWNGPLGMFEDRRFACGTETIAREISKLTSERKIKSIAGGGDVVSALEQCGLADNFSYISTAGGAFLEWLEGKELPGVIALKK